MLLKRALCLANIYCTYMLTSLGYSCFIVKAKLGKHTLFFFMFYVVGLIKYDNIIKCYDMKRFPKCMFVNVIGYCIKYALLTK